MRNISCIHMIIVQGGNLGVVISNFFSYELLINKFSDNKRQLKPRYWTTTSQQKRDNLRTEVL